MCECLEVDSVIKHFGDVALLTDVYLRCEPGDIIALFGWNGCGKSTLLKIIFGTMACERRFIRIDGVVQQREAFRSGLLAYLPQHNFLPPGLSVEEVVRLYIPPEGRGSFMNDAHLCGILGARAGELSGGEQRYLEIRLILGCSARYILLDEPFNGLSPVACEAIREHIRRAAKTKGILFTDHNFREAHKISTRTLLLDQCYLKEIKEMEELAGYGYAIPCTPLAISPTPCSR